MPRKGYIGKRSVTVVFPASMCAIIPIFRVFSSANALATVIPPFCQKQYASNYHL